MNSTMKVTGVVIFGVLLSFALPHIMSINNTKSLETESQREMQTETTTSSSNEVAIATPKDESGTPIETTIEPVQEPEPGQTAEPAPVVEEPQAEPIVYDGMTLDELAEKLNRSLKSTLSGTGMSFAKYAVEMGIDPYLAVAIVLHETGCSHSCSTQVKQCYNVGGMKGGPSCNGTSYKKFASLDDGIYSFMYNLKTNYYDKGLTTAAQMNKKYAASKSWSTKVNNYINKIKAA